MLDPCELRRAGWAFTLSDMRDLDTIDSELRLLVAVRWSIREHAGEPSSRQVDELLDERFSAPSRGYRGRGRGSRHVASGPAVPHSTQRVFTCYTLIELCQIGKVREGAVASIPLP